MHWALNRGSSAKHSTEYPRVLKLWMVFAKRWTSSYGDPPKSNMLCTGVQTFQKRKPNQQWPTIHGEDPQQEAHCNAQGQNVQEESKKQFKFKSTSTTFQEHTTNMLCYDPQLQGYFIWHCHLSHDPLAATSLDHTSTLVQNKEQQQTTEELQKPSNESTSVQLVTTDIKTDNSS